MWTMSPEFYSYQVTGNNEACILTNCYDNSLTICASFVELNEQCT